jgi:SAM-dependent methyltransferase
LQELPVRSYLLEVTVVWCRDVLEVIPDLQAGLSEVARVLKPGGSAVIYTVFATPRLEPREAAAVNQPLGSVPQNLERAWVEEASERRVSVSNDSRRSEPRSVNTRRNVRNPYQRAWCLSLATLEPVELAENLKQWITEAVRRQRGGVAPAWDEFEVRELPSLPTLSPTLGKARHRYDLIFKTGPLSADYPTRAARELMAEIPQRLTLAFSGEVIGGRARAHVVEEHQQVHEEVDDEGRTTLTVTVPASVELLY